jgi:hypothetical protein
MRHSAAHVMAEAPTADGQARHRSGDRRRLLLRLRPAAPAHPRRPRGDRGADAHQHRRRPSLRTT